MMNIALLYGEKDFHCRDIRFTLLDKNLRNTVYAPFIDELRGLRVICKIGLPTPEIITVYWHNKTKRKVRRSAHQFLNISDNESMSGLTQKASESLDLL